MGSDGTQWWTQTTPIGALTVFARNGIVCRVLLPGSSPDGPPDAVAGRDDAVARQLDEYFRGARVRLEVEVDLDDVSGAFRRRVLETLHERVAYGETVSYGELAEMAGSPAAFRAVGTAMATNPVPIFVPCHRVLAAGGRIGGYGGGLAMKRALLVLEGVEVG